MKKNLCSQCGKNKFSDDGIPLLCDCDLESLSKKEDFQHIKKSCINCNKRQDCKSFIEVYNIINKGLQEHKFGTSKNRTDEQSFSFLNVYESLANICSEFNPEFYTDDLTKNLEINTLIQDMVKKINIEILDEISNDATKILLLSNNHKKELITNILETHEEIILKTLKKNNLEDHLEQFYWHILGYFGC